MNGTKHGTPTARANPSQQVIGYDISGFCWRRPAFTYHSPQSNRIWPSLPPVSKNSSLRAGFGAAIQGNMDQCFGASPWIATSQALLAMTEGGNDGGGQ